MTATTQARPWPEARLGTCPRSNAKALSSSWRPPVDRRTADELTDIAMFTHGRWAQRSCYVTLVIVPVIGPVSRQSKHTPTRGSQFVKSLSTRGPTVSVPPACANCFVPPVITTSKVGPGPPVNVPPIVPVNVAPPAVVNVIVPSNVMNPSILTHTL